MNYLEKPNKELLLDILTNIGTDEQTIRNDVKALIEWLEKTPYLPSNKDEEFLISILVRCKNSMEKAKSFLDYYYSRRTLGKDMFSVRDPCNEELKRSFYLFHFIPLPKLSADGYRIIACSHPPSNVDLPKIDAVLSAWQIQLEVLMKSDLSKGFILISDIGTLNVALFTYLFSEFKKIVEVMKKTCRIRFKNQYFINVTPTIHSFMDIAAPYLPHKMTSRMQYWSKKPEDLVEVLPKEILPSNFGGDERPLHELLDAWYEFVVQHKSWFKLEEMMRADLSKRPKNDSLSEEFSSFGLSGSFRKISLD